MLCNVLPIEIRVGLKAIHVDEAVIGIVREVVSFDIIFVRVKMDRALQSQTIQCSPKELIF